MMKQLLPDYYQRNGETETEKMQDTIDPAIAAAQEAWGVGKELEEQPGDSFVQQLLVNTTTWGLKLWEKLYGLDTDPSKSEKDRRARILSKMRGKGTTTRDMIQNLAESFVNGNIMIQEYPESNRFTIQFGDIGVPPLLDDLSAAIDEIKPAHLQYTYDIRYLTHREIAQAKWTHLALNSKKCTHIQIRGGEINGNRNQ
ncbi:putative phage tail protein [Clostridium sp. D33t1_170424_F3]|uniref:putative phage tail protein n=1 Tax=Clostridium sp. D33t1_170424_F3 TaxID=2787099 RepID=UPI0018A8AC9D|nr:putative phage tail protein [Clostridium sp. D33t1_170424_F3]